MKSILKITFFAVAILMLTSCLNIKKTPKYKTEYTYIPPTPKTELSSLCLSQCGTAKAQCKQLEKIRADTQIIEEERKEEECRKAAPPAKGGRCLVFSWKRYTNYDNCVANYNTCFTTCGGKTTSKKVCKSNCNIKPKK